MPRFWGFHQPVIHYSQLRFMEGKTYPFPTPADPQMRAGDYVYLFWDNEMLYGWGIIQNLKPREDSLKDAVVLLVVSRPPIARFNEDIKTNPLFTHYERQKHEGCLSTFNDDQLRYLNSLLRGSAASSPPNPEEVREQTASTMPLRPFQAEFILNEKLPMDESRFVEYKEITVGDIVPQLLKRVDEYVIAFLNLEDRRYEDYCRMFFGVRDKDCVVVGIPLTRSLRDEVKLRVSGKLKTIKPPIAFSSFYVEPRQVIDKSGSPINDIYVVEVGVGRGETGYLYCSEGESFYIRLDASNEPLKGQQLVTEIKRRVKLGIL